MINVVLQAAFGFAQGGYQIIVDGIVGPGSCHHSAPPATTGTPLRYLVLRPDEASTLRRATSRGHDALIDPAPVRDRHRQFSKLTDL